MKYCLLVFTLLVSPLAQAQEVLNNDGICYRVIAGSEKYHDTKLSEEFILKCFDEALARCAAHSGFTNCITKSNDMIMEALETAYKSFDQSSLNAPLPARRTAWTQFEADFLNLKKTKTNGADEEVDRFRQLLLAAMKINRLR